MKAEAVEVPQVVLEAVRNKDVKTLCKVLFDHDLTEGQIEIVRTIAYTTHRRVAINCMTRYGKSFAVADGVCLYILFHRDKRVSLIGPQREQAGILRDYIADNIMKCPLLRDIAMITATGVERLRKEASKNRLTFTNGMEYRIFSAYHDAKAIMGFGGDLIIVDESCLISPTAWPKIVRMLGDAPDDAALVMLANPWSRNNYYGEAWDSPRFHNIHVGWERAVQEGRITKEFVDEMRDTMPPMEFQVLYESEFPDQAEDALISEAWVRRALEQEFTWTPTHVYFGVDVARYGTDLTVIMVVGYHKELGEWKVINAWSYHRQSLTATAGQIINLTKRYNPHRIYVDDTGLGGGVTDILRESNKTAEKVVAVVAGSREELNETEKERFDNISSRNAVRLADLFQKGKIAMKPVGKLQHELIQPVFKFTSAGKTKVDKNPDDQKSPDFFDALCLACSHSDQHTELVYGFLGR